MSHPRWLEGNQAMGAKQQVEVYHEGNEVHRDVVEIRIDASVTVIPDRTFSGCSSLTTVRLPESLQTIGEEAFHRCSSLTTIELPGSLQIIGNNAFSHCPSLKTIRFPESLQTMGDQALSHCPSLTTIRLPESLRTIGDHAFSHCPSLTTIQLPEFIQTIRAGTFSHCPSLTTVQLSKSLQTIGAEVFHKCSSLAKIQLPDSLQMIEENAFSHCSSLTTIQLPGSLRRIRYRAFFGCRSLLAVQGGGTELEIQNEAFANCRLLAAIQLSGPLLNVAKNAFKGCETLNQVTNESGAREFVRNRWKDHALHQICFKTDTTSDAIVRVCRAVSPDKLKAEDRLGMTALHLLVLNRSATVGMVKTLLEKCPILLLHQDSQKMTPLHCACYNCETDPGIINLLCDHLHNKNRQLSAIPDKQGDTPTALAIRHFGPKNDIALHLYKRHPVKAQELKMNKEREILEEVSARYIEALKESAPTSIEGCSRYEQDGWAAFVMDPPQNETVEKCIEFIRNGSSEQTANVLAYSKDFYGRVALDVAISDIKKTLQERVLFLGRYDLVKGPPLHESPTSIVIKALDKKTEEEYKKAFEEAIKEKKTKYGTLSKEDVKQLLRGKLDIQYGIYEGSLDVWGRNKNGQISLGEFLKFCMSELVAGGGERWVAIKFMKHEQQYRREIANREELDPAFVVRYIDHDSVNSHNNSKDDFHGIIKSALDIALAGWTEGKIDSGHYKHFIVMPFADRNLDAIFRNERLGPVRVRELSESLAEGLKSIHEKGIIHGDVKLLNLVRVHGSVRLIDFDAAASKGDPIGAKFSSGVLPPEMFAKLSTSQYKEYKVYFSQNYPDGEGQVAWDKENWTKVKPMKYARNEWFGIKTFVNRRIEETDPDGNVDIWEDPVSKESLPYELVKATPAIDVWSFGVVLYTLWTGQSPLQTDRDNNLVQAVDMKKLCEWDKIAPSLLDEKVTDEAARDLLEHLLCSRGSGRYKSMEQVLAHPFYSEKAFMDKQAEKTQAMVIEESEKIRAVVKEEGEKTRAAFMTMSNNSATKLKELQRVLLTSIFESNEVETPTSFVILSEELPSTINNDLSSSPEWEYVLEDDREGSDLLEVVANPEWQRPYDNAMKWVKKTSGIVTGLRGRKLGTVLDQVKGSLRELLKEKMYLYLVDELTGEPVPEAKYEITTPTELVPRLLPYMVWTMRGASLCNGVLGLVKMFGFPFPKIPKKWRERGQQTIELLKQKSSVEQFETIHRDFEAAIEDGHGQEARSYRGMALRHLKEFLKEEERKSKKVTSYGGLNRYVNMRNGVSMWSLCDSKEEFDCKLEERLNGRNTEAQREFQARESLQRELENERQHWENERRQWENKCEHLENESQQWEYERQQLQGQIEQLQRGLNKSNDCGKQGGQDDACACVIL